MSRVPTLQLLKAQAAEVWQRRPWRLESDCRFCGVPGQEACAACVEALPRIEAPCPRCGLPSGTGEPCGACLGRPPAFARVAARFAYRFPIDRAMQRFKFAGELATGRWLADQLACDVGSLEAPDLIVSPPTTRERLALRGFDPALLIARRVGRVQGVPVRPSVLRRRRDTEHQPGLGREARRRNLRDAFECRESLDGARVAIVDDVMTTGSTVEAVARALRAAGARQVEVWVVARTPEPGSR